MRIDWDAGKAKDNIAKHGVSFEEAESALADPGVVTWFDEGIRPAKIGSCRSECRVSHECCRSFILNAMKTPSALSAHAGRPKPNNGSTPKARPNRRSTSAASDELDFSKLIPIIGNGLLADDAGGHRVATTYVVVDDATVAFTLEDGRRVSAPLAWYPRLLHGTPAERNSWELRSNGRVVIWRSLRIGISAKALVDGTKSNESAKSFKEWMASRKQVGQRRKAG